jgi:hypothetical protein
MYCKNEASCKKILEFDGRFELYIKFHYFGKDVCYECLHEISRHLRFDERHIMLVSIDEATDPEEVTDSNHDVREIVIGNEWKNIMRKSYLSWHDVVII